MNKLHKILIFTVLVVALVLVASFPFSMVFQGAGLNRVVSDGFSWVNGVVSVNSEFVYSVDQDGFIRGYDVEGDFSSTVEFIGVDVGAIDIVSSPDGSKVSTGLYNGDVIMYDVNVDGSLTQKYFKSLEMVDAIMAYLPNNDEENLRKIHICGPNTLPYHLIHYPSILLATKNKLPTEMFFHGYFNTNFKNSFKDIILKDSPQFLRMYLFHNKNPYKNSSFNEIEYENFKRFVSRKINIVAPKIPYESIKIKPKDEEIKLFDEYIYSFRFDKALKDTFSTLDELRAKIESNTITSEELITKGAILNYKIDPFLTKNIVEYAK